MAGKRPRHIQRTTSMSQLGNPGSLYQGLNGGLGGPIRGRSCPPKQELGHASMEPCPEAVKSAGLLPSDMEEHVSNMVVDSSGGESISVSCLPWSGADRLLFDRTLMPNGETYTCFGMYQRPSEHLCGKASETSYRRNGRFDSDRSRPVNFLDMCYLCSKLLGHGRDVYIYRGDRAFCSAECRQLQILADEQREKNALTGASDGPVTAVQVSDASNVSHVETVLAA